MMIATLEIREKQYLIEQMLRIEKKGNILTKKNNGRKGYEGGDIENV